MRPFKLNNPPQGGVALVTGAGSGIGRCFAIRLARMGYDVVLVGLPDGSLAESKALIANETPERRCWICEMDLAERDSAEGLFDWCVTREIRPCVLINNAGVFAYCDLLSQSTTRIERLLMLHCLTLTQSCRLFGEMMAKELGGGYILNLASYSQWMPFPGLSLYGASKGYVANFTRGFSKEVESCGVTVTAVAPAGVATPLYGLPDNLQRLGLRLGVLISADSCARRGLIALSRGRRVVVPDWWNTLFIPLCRHMPGFIERFIRKRTIKFQK